MNIYYDCHNEDCKKVTHISEHTECCPICQSENGEVINQDERNRLEDAKVLFVPEDDES